MKKLPKLNLALFMAHQLDKHYVTVGGKETTLTTCNTATGGDDPDCLSESYDDDGNLMHYHICSAK